MRKYARIPIYLLWGTFFLLSLFTSDIYAQTREISGVVQDRESGTGLGGVTIMVKGTQVGTTSNESGQFSISAEGNATLEFSMVGYQTREIALSGASVPLKVELTKGNASLDEVVVISYGTSKKSDITGAIGVLNFSNVRDVPATQIGQKMQGKVAGVEINQVSGRPGAGMQFRVRGAASFSGGFQPLYVVDGQPIVGANSTNGDISFLSPDDIQDITVLKDAEASALYGSRASNGVILITTKHGTPGRTNISLSAYNAWQKVPDRGKPDLMNAREFATFMKGFYEDKATYEGYTGGVPSVYANPDQYGKGTDWYNALLRTAPMQSFSLSLSTGTEKVSSATTMTYMNQDGIMINTNFKRYSVHSNNEYRPNKVLKFGLNVAPSYEKSHNTGGMIDGNRQVIGIAAIASPLVPIYDDNGNFIPAISSPGMLGVANPVQQMSILDDNVDHFRLLSNLYGEVEILKGLKFRSSFNTDLGSSDENIFFGSFYSRSFNPKLPHPASGNSAVNGSYNYLSWTNENTLNYDFSINKHNFKALAGYSSQKWWRNFRSVNGSNFAGDEIKWIAGAATTSGSTNREVWSLASAFGRIIYNFDEKYFLTGSIRRDGSSRFGADKKYGYFPAVSAGWVMSKENFFPEISSISFAKIRASYGRTGNFNIGNYQQVSNISATNYVFGGNLTPGLSLTNLGNKNLTWETTDQLNIGLDLSLINNRINFSYDFYNKITRGMLFAAPLPNASGFSSIVDNVGKLRIWGHEVQISSVNLTGKLYWTTDFNISFNRNIVQELPPNTPFIGGGARYSGFNRTVVGQPIAQFYGYIFEGIYETQRDLDNNPKDETSALGSAMMKDVNGDGKITPDDRTLIGNPNPDFIYGMTNSFSYGKFDLNIIISGSQGGKILNFNKQDGTNNDGVFNMLKSMLPRWRSPQDVGDGKTPGTHGGSTELFRLANTTWIENGSYLAMKNITLGYTFNLDQLKFMQSARLYFGIQNAFFLTKYTGPNPEARSSLDDSILNYGQDLSITPIPRTMTLGVNINF